MRIAVRPVSKASTLDWGRVRQPPRVARLPRARSVWVWWRALLMLLGSGLLSASVPPTIARPFAVGLSEPRGMALDAAGNLIVAETGAFDPASGDLPVTSNHRSGVARVALDGRVTPMLHGLPAVHYRGSGIDVGVADVAVIDGTLYLLTGEGDDRLSRAVLRVPADGRPELVASILNFAMAGSPLGQMMGASAIAANPYAMVAAPDGSALYVADGAAGRVLRVGLDGSIRVFAALPKLDPLTGLAFGPDGRLYFADFGPLPHVPGSGTIWAADPSGQLSVAASGLTMPIDVAFDRAGTLYVLEFGDSRAPGGPYAPDSGRLQRIERNGTRALVLDRLNFPTAMVFSPAGDLYLAVGGAFSAARQGAILKVPCRALGRPRACARPVPQ